ncbi:putative methyltransferase [Thioflavicoccus mobilis 8321]|uniref:Putative methyltransferase n=1 Tax=Thioflavicoccus mobilis 8321 TaxID=765912 RepID=L0GY59_9GAMM|nr:methyltransferase [Thioflavicoccus mobilis]AGA90315.1 putative methyltransferase [Thioflavicoccus mobilis 8321]
MSVEHVRISCGIRILQQKHPLIRSLRKAGSEPTIYGTRVWQSSLMLIEYLREHPLIERQRIIEIGCGWGLVGIFCAKRFAADVLLTDVDEQVFPYALAHANLNEVTVQTERACFDSLAEASLRGRNVIVGADVCFWPELTSQLRRLIARAASFGIERVVIADPGRTTFMRLAEYCQRHFMATMTPYRMSTRTKSGGFILIVENLR